MISQYVNDSFDLPNADRPYRLAFDTIGLCAFNYRFNDFYSENVHPFAHQMTETLLEAAKRANRAKLQTSMRIWSTAKMQENIDAMHKLCKDIITERKAHPQPDVNDLLNTMLNVADPVTGEKLDDENVCIHHLFSNERPHYSPKENSKTSKFCNCY